MARACCLPSQQIIIYVTPPAPHLFIIGTKELWQTHLCLCCCIIVSGLGSISTPFVSWLLERFQDFHTVWSQIAHWASIAYSHAALMISCISLFVRQFARFMYVGFFCCHIISDILSQQKNSRNFSQCPDLIQAPHTSVAAMTLLE